MNAASFVISDEVRAALEAGRPVVALESTIIAHGMPYPENVATALAVEGIVRARGAVPATIGILDGRIRIGMSAAEIERMGTAAGVMKACERDIALAVARRADAATTAGASLALAATAGIRVFVTGGIGAVGPNASKDLDISADLPALAEYDAVTVCAGAKAFMDIAATLEWLETQRVMVGTWRADEFPLFFLRSSGLKSPWRVDTAEEVAGVFRARRELGLKGGILLAVPLAEEEAMGAAEAQAAMAEALRWAEAGGVSGKELTPFLLGKIKEITGGRSLASNIALIRNNAVIGAEVAVALA